MLWVDPIVIANITNYGLQYFGDILGKYAVPEGYLELGNRYGLSEGYVFGIRNHSKTLGCCFCFADYNMPRSRRTELILEHTLPHLHQALVRLVNFRNAKNKAQIKLTPKETEILKWVSKGKNTCDISAILNISERTVKFHIGNILVKLDAMNRSHALAIALQEGLTDIE